MSTTVTGFTIDTSLPDGVLVNEGGVVKIQYPLPGPSGGDKNYVHDQMIAAATWNVVHNLGKYPAITVVDSGGTEWIGDYNFPDANHATLFFNAAFAGRAFFN